jgi:peptidoglycan/xylan/chitin deacetylase (PgdA/CDA1 family)
MRMRTVAKDLLFALTRFGGFNAAVRAGLRHHLAVFCYHGVVRGDHSQDRFRYHNTVSEREFDQQLAFLTRHFHIVSVAEVIAAFRGEARLPAGAALITFDDGYQNNLSLAAPLLKQHGVPAVVHVSTAYMGTNRTLWPEEVATRILCWPEPTVEMPGEGRSAAVPPNPGDRRTLAESIREACKLISNRDKELYLSYLRRYTIAEPDDAAQELFGFMNWDEVRQLGEFGVDIGSHTVNHPILTKCDPGELISELRESKRVIESQTGKPCRAIAYPNGGAEDFNNEVMKKAEEAGYELAFTVSDTWARLSESRFAVGRIAVSGHTSRSYFQFKASGVHALVNRL